MSSQRRVGASTSRRLSRVCSLHAGSDSDWLNSTRPVSFLDFGPDLAPSDLRFSVLCPHSSSLQSRPLSPSVPHLPLPSSSSTTRSWRRISTMVSGVSLPRPRYLKGKPPPLDFTSVISGDATPSPPSTPPELTRSASTTTLSRLPRSLLKRVVRHHVSASSVAKLSRPGDRTSFQSSSSSDTRESSDAGHSVSSADTSYSAFSSLFTPDPKVLPELVESTQTPPVAPPTSNSAHSTDESPRTPDCDGLYEADNATNDLLLHLYPPDAPSFIDWDPSLPPSRILDLGCGTGEWARHAATAWPHAHVTGLDTAHYSWEHWPSEHPGPDNLAWVNHNFIEERLPFSDGEFDYVRIAACALRIPPDRWQTLFLEVSRVLRFHGQLELINDEFFFPTPVTPLSSDEPETSRESRRFDAVPAAVVEETSDAEDDRTLTARRHTGNSDCDSLSTLRVSSGNTHPRPPPRFGHADWNDMRTHLSDMEKLFKTMLSARHRLPLHSSKLGTELIDVFGLGAVIAHPTRRVCLPSREYAHNEGAHVPVHSAPSSELATPPRRVSGKAARMLGLHARTGAHQPAGFVVVSGRGEPSRFVPFSPQALERHACRYVDALIRAEDTLREAVCAYVDVDGEQVVMEHEFEESMWDYRTYRRRRFNWPEHHPGDGFRDEFRKDTPAAMHTYRPRPRRSGPDHEASPGAERLVESRAPRRSNGSSTTATSTASAVPFPTGLPPDEGLTAVRIFRIFSARKM